DRGLTADEQAAGRAYWSATWQKPSGDPALDTAWSTLVNSVARGRAGWVAAALTPTNFGQAGAGTPAFPDVGPPLGNAALARLLPDRFAAVAWQGPARSDAVGVAIPPALMMGLLSNDGSDRAIVNGVPVIPQGTDWIVDYNRAVAVGMAINLPLKNAGAKVDRLFVMGVRSSLDAAGTAKELESLLAGHRYSRGLAFLAQGAPTNNTERSRAARP